MTEKTTTAAASAREHARTSTGQFGTQPRPEAELDLPTPAPEPYVQLVTHASSMEDAAATVTRRGWTLGEISWPREPGEETKRTDYTPTQADAAAIRSILEADNDAPVAVYWEEREWHEADDDRHSTDECLFIEAGDACEPYELGDGGEAADALRVLFADLDAEADTNHPLY